ncbi:MAG: ABC transporter permease subunit, partial [Lachnospiraceae bacterium]|nr:ABC transporter permease subunit [Lachnospiraceae bacterium]
MNRSLQISTTKDKVLGVVVTLGLIALFLFSTRSLELDFPKFIGRIVNAPEILGKFMTLNWSIIGEVFANMVASVFIAVAALAVGVVLSVILAFLAAENITPNKAVAAVIKGSIAVIRAVPALIWILMVVASYGFGNTGGMIGLVFPTTGYLVKSFTASIEDLGYDLIEAMRTTGANRLTIIVRALFPTLTGSFLSWTAIRLEG